MIVGNREFKEVWAVDFEFSAAPGNIPTPICLVALELSSGRKLRIWEDGLRGRTSAPYPTNADSLVVAYYASAEMGCHLALGWDLPECVLDLYVEFRNLTNGKSVPCGSGLLGALSYFGLDSINSAEKDSMRELAMRGSPWTNQEKDALLDYCESDVQALAKLLPCMNKDLDTQRALLRGRYMKAAARIEYNGIPIDTESLEILRSKWSEIQDELIAEIDAEYGVYEGRTFKSGKWEEYLAANGIPWIRLDSGALALDDNTFQQMAKAHPKVAPIRELRVSLSQMRLADLAVGLDGRNRCLLSAFRARTSRNQPSNSQFIFGPSVWLRSLIKPEKETGLAYIDWSQQEFGIAAALSDDDKMIKAYESGDPYLAFAKQAGAVPTDGTKATHGAVREQFKQCVLAVQYGMGAESLALRIGQPTAQARELLRMYKETYRKYWQWSEGAVSHAMLYGWLHTVFGWRIQVSETSNSRSLSNFPMQSNGAEMLRLACCLVSEAGIRICAPVHDALLIEAPLTELETAVEATQKLMADASAMVLSGFRLRADAKRVRFPERYQDERGTKMWHTVWRLLEQLKTGEPEH